MLGCDERPGRPPDRTVCGDRRSRGPGSPGPRTVYLLAAPDGMPIAWCLADPKTGERDVCLDLLTIAVETGRLAPGSTVLGDKGLAGREIENQIAALGITLLRPDRRDERARHGNLGGVRQWIESVFDTLKGQLGLERHGGRTCQGVGTRVAQRLFALAAAVWHNRTTNAPTQAQPHRLRPLNNRFTESII